MEQARRHPDLFTPAEAAEYLRLESERGLEAIRENYHLPGLRVGKGYMYHREDLDECVLRMFGKNDGVKFPAESNEQPQLKLYGGRR